MRIKDYDKQNRIKDALLDELVRMVQRTLLNQEP